MSEFQFSGKIPQIAWGDEFLSWDRDRQLRYAKDLASAMNEAARQVQAERDEALAEIVRLEKLLKSADEQVAIQKKIAMDNILQSNAQSQSDAARIQEVEKELKQAKQTIEDLRR